MVNFEDRHTTVFVGLHGCIDNGCKSEGYLDATRWALPSGEWLRAAHPTHAAGNNPSAAQGSTEVTRGGGREGFAKQAMHQADLPDLASR